MKYIKKFNEELSPGIYKNAGVLMKQRFKQNKRGDILLDYAKKKKIEGYAKNGVFECNITKYNYNDKTENILMTGNFYITMSVEMWWFLDMFSDDYYDRRTTDTLFPLELGIMPADEETQKKFDAMTGEFVDEVTDNILWTNRLWLDSVHFNYNNLFEGRDYTKFYFTNRKDAVKFKKLLLDAFLDKNDFGRYDKKISSVFKNGFKSLNDDIERHDGVSSVINVEEKYNNMIKAVKSFSINALYRD